MRFVETSGSHGAVPLLSSLIGCYSVVMYSKPDGPLYRYNNELLSEGRDIRLGKTMGASP